jgi:hypothetical protein
VNRGRAARWTLTSWANGSSNAPAQRRLSTRSGLASLPARSPPAGDVQPYRPSSLPRTGCSCGDAIEHADIVEPTSVGDCIFLGRRGSECEEPFRARGFEISRSATPALAWPHRCMSFPAGRWHATDAVSSMTRSGHRTAAPRSSFRNGGAATFFPWAAPIPRGDKKVAAPPSCAALRP